MKTLVSSIIMATQLASKKPNKDIQQQMKLEQKVSQNKTIGIKKKYVAKHTSTKFAGIPMQVGATAYYGDTITSTGTVPKVGHTIAVDPKVIPYGTRVYIPALGKIFVAEDCGSAIKGNRIDVFMGSYNECMEFGYRTITIYILED